MKLLYQTSVIAQFHAVPLPPLHIRLLPFAQTSSTFKANMGYALGVVFFFGFIYGVIKIWGGAERLSKGDADGKMGIVAGIIIAASGAIMGVLFTIFGMNGGVLSPSW